MKKINYFKIGFHFCVLIFCLNINITDKNKDKLNPDKSNEEKKDKPKENEIKKEITTEIKKENVKEPAKESIKESVKETIKEEIKESKKEDTKKDDHESKKEEKKEHEDKKEHEEKKEEHEVKEHDLDKKEKEHEPEKIGPEHITKEDKKETGLKEKVLEELKLTAKKDKKAKERAEEEKKEETIISSLDTLNVGDEGNWLLKRVWWEQAEATFEKIIDVNNQIVQTQTDYFNKHKDVDKNLATIFRKLGYEQGELNEVLSHFLGELEKERKDFDLSLEEREFLELLNSKKNELEKLKTNLETLETYDSNVEDVLNQLLGQIDRSREYEKKAWDDFKEIGRVLNDKKAKVLFYQIDADLKNVQNILDYIKGKLYKYFEALLNKIHDLSQSVSKDVESLAKQELDFKNQFEKLKKIGEQKEIERKKREQELKEKSKIKKKEGWLTYIKEWFLTPIEWVKSFFVKKGPVVRKEVDLKNDTDEPKSDEKKEALEKEIKEERIVKKIEIKKNDLGEKVEIDKNEDITVKLND